MRLIKGPSAALSKENSFPMLIGSKLDIPPLKPKMLLRTALIGRLRAGCGARLIVVSGEAASGKTSLACQWIEREKLRAAWYALDQDDNNPDLFLRYLLTALAKSDTSFDSLIRPWLRSQQGFAIRDIAPVLVNHYQQVGADLCLILDDYHLIRNDTVHEMVSWLLSHLPPRLHLVILSRHNLPFSVSALRVRGQVAEICAQDMRLTEGESRRFLTDILPCRLSEQQMSEAFRKTEGWIGGLQLIGLTIRTNGSQPTHQWTTEYLLNEVIDIQRERVRRFLLTIGLLDRFNAALCRELTGFDDAGDLLDHIVRNNLFIVSLDAEGGWYRCHHLLSEAVEKRRLAEAPEEVSDIRRRAALWFAGQGLAEDALRHAFEAADLEFAADLFENLSDVFVARHELLSLQRWLNRVPPVILHERALLLLLQADIFQESVQRSKMASILADIEKRQAFLFARYEGNRRKFCEDLFETLKGIAELYDNFLNADMEKLEKNYQDRLPHNPSFAAMFKILSALRYFHRGDLGQAVDTLMAVEWVADESEYPSITIQWFKLMAAVANHQGRLMQAQDTLDKALSFLEREGLSRSPLRFQISPERAWLHFFRNDIARAEEIAAEALTYTESFDEKHVFMDLVNLMSLIHFRQGRLNDAEAMLKRVTTEALTSGLEYWLPYLEVLLAVVSVLKGDTEGVTQWMRKREPHLSSAPVSIMDCVEHEIYAVLLSLQGRFQEALSIRDRLRKRCVDGDMGGFVLRIDVARSTKLSVLGRHDESKTILSQSLALAEPEGYIMPFVHNGPIIAPVLQQIAADQDGPVTPAFVQTILEACGLGGRGVTNQSGPPDNDLNRLSARESEILGLMVQGYKNREIAEQAFVSPETVKTHLKHIFEKLHVETRTQAIRRAQELKLL